MNTELLTADLTAVNYLCHYGVAGMEWYKNKADRFQYHAKYAKGAKAPKVKYISESSALASLDKEATKAADAAKKAALDKGKTFSKEDYSKVYSKALKEADAKLDRKIVNENATKTYLAAIALNMAMLNVPYAAINASRLVIAKNAESKDKKNDERMSKLKVDKKTGLRLKESEMTPEEDMKHINPGFRDMNSNTKNNCMLCTTAYEMRRRGYDVAAEKVGIGYSFDAIKKWFPDVKIKQISNETGDSNKKQIVKSNLGLNYSFGKDLVSKLSKEPDGSRGNLCLWWGATGQSGHSIVYEIKDGKPIFRDCQANKTFDEKSILKYLKNTNGAEYARLDNVAFNAKAIKEVLR